MHGNVPFGVASATEIARHNSQHPDRIVGPTKFGIIAKVLWIPPNTAAQLAAIPQPNVSVRTAERWLSGEIEPPFVIVAATMNAIFKRE
jgi:hypothetical protein